MTCGGSRSGSTQKTSTSGAEASVASPFGQRPGVTFNYLPCWFPISEASCRSASVGDANRARPGAIDMRCRRAEQESGRAVSNEAEPSRPRHLAANIGSRRVQRRRRSCQRSRGLVPSDGFWKLLWLFSPRRHNAAGLSHPVHRPGPVQALSFCAVRLPPPRPLLQPGQIRFRTSPCALSATPTTARSCRLSSGQSSHTGSPV